MEKDYWDDYLIDGTDVLKNNLNIDDKEKLKEIERNISRTNIAALYLNPICKNFDIEDLKRIHHFIFKKIYPFAGKIRLCTLGKNKTSFCDPKNIENYLIDILNDLNNIPNISSISEFAFYIAPFYHDLIMVHPFREGNGRTIRVFIREFVLEKSKNLPCGPLDVDYTKMDSKNLLLGTVERYVFPSMLELEFMKAIVKKEKEKEDSHQI